MAVSDTTFYRVYFLIDPFDMQIFYVGISDNPIERYIQHISMRDDNKGKNTKVQEIIKRGSLPILYVFFMGIQGKHNVMLYEAAWTEVLLQQKQPLTNRTMKVYEHNPAYHGLLESFTAIAEAMGLKEGNPFVLLDNRQIGEYVENLTTHDTAFQDMLKERGYVVTLNGYPLWVEDDLKENK